jgi:DNA mismatch repair ATPase MutS
MKFLNKKQREAIGYEFIIQNLDLLTPYSKEKIKNLEPYSKESLEELKKEFENIEFFIQKREESNEFFQKIDKNLSNYKNIRNTINRVEISHTLDDVEFFELKNFALNIEKLNSLLNEADINIEIINFHSLGSIINLLDPERKKLPTFHIYGAYSEKLKEIREMKQKVETQILKESNKNIKPNLMKERAEIVALEEKEELNIRRELTQKMSKYVEIIRKNIGVLTYLDILNAKSKIALEFGGIKPKIGNSLSLELKEFYNPYIDDILSKSDKKFIPISIKLNKGVTVITGANMGGKSVTLKTIALNILLSIMGFFVYAKEAKIPIVEYIHYISEDLQSVQRGLSSFGAEIISLEKSLKFMKESEGIFLIDEFARGTNPQEAYILNKAILDYLKGFNCITIAVTHYDGIIEESMNHYQVIGLSNVNFEELKNEIKINKKSGVTIIQEYMDYRLVKVSSDTEIPKDALNISILLGLDPDIIYLAKKYYKKGVENKRKKKSNKK